MLADPDEPSTSEIRGPREVQAVAEALEETSRRLSAAIARSEAVAEEASHHLRTPLGALRLRVESLADSDDPDVHDQAEAALVEIDRLNRRIEQILTLSRGTVESDWELVDVPGAVRARQSHYEVLAQRQGLHLSIDPGPTDAYVLAPPGTVERTVDELVANAASYARSSIEVSISADGGSVWVEVRDDGPGVNRAERDLIFDRFVRGTDAVAGGTGLGLAMVRDSARQIGGDALVADSNSGMVLRVEWPRRPADANSDRDDVDPGSDVAVADSATSADAPTPVGPVILNLP